MLNIGWIASDNVSEAYCGGIETFFGGLCANTDCPSNLNFSDTSTIVDALAFIILFFQSDPPDILHPSNKHEYWIPDKTTEM